VESILLKHNFKNRRIHVTDINLESALYVSDQIRYFSETDPSQPIYLLIYSYGGEIDACSLIIDEINASKENGVIIVTVAMSVAYSAAVDILARGTVGYRYARPHSTIMVHPISYGLKSDYQEYQNKLNDFIKKRQATSNKEMAEILGTKPAKYIKDVEKSLWLTPEEAIKN
jgi:ATP-dependent Clp protease protease subunit